MSHKEKCIAICKEMLDLRQVSFSQTDFDHFYRKNKGGQGNTYSIASGAFDFIIREVNKRVRQ